MKTNKKAIGLQRRLMDKKIRPWLSQRLDRRPPTGWLRAIRGALGISSRQLAQITGVDASAILRLEERERGGKVTLELLDRAANAMGCKVIYAIVPRDEFDSLEAIVDIQAKKVAKDLLQKVEHSMRLEEQGSSEESKIELEKLTEDLKRKMDSRIWGLTKPTKGSNK